MSTRPALSTLLSINAGYVDTAGFLALQGLFTAHVTGNFVTLGATLVHGTSGAVAKLIALPVFCVVVGLVRLLGVALSRFGIGNVKPLLGLKVLFLVLGSICAITFGPFPDGDKWPALLTGMTLVTAMAIQNAVQRIHLTDAPPSTLMTGNTTQIVIDAVDVLRGAIDGAGPARGRLRRMGQSVLSFACGCAMAAGFFAAFSLWCFVLPPIFGLAGLMLGPEMSEPKG